MVNYATACLTNIDDKLSQRPCLPELRVLYYLCKTYTMCIVPHIIVQMGQRVDGVCIHSLVCVN